MGWLLGENSAVRLAVLKQPLHVRLLRVMVNEKHLSGENVVFVDLRSHENIRAETGVDVSTVSAEVVPDLHLNNVALDANIATRWTGRVLQANFLVKVNHLQLVLLEAICRIFVDVIQIRLQIANNIVLRVSVICDELGISPR